MTNGGTRTGVAGNGTSGNMPTPGADDVIVYRIVSDGAGDVTVWCQPEATLGNWDNSNKVFESSDFATGVFASGGMIGFMGSSQTAYVDDFKLTIDTTGNGTPDTVAHKDDFELDGGYAEVIDAADFDAHDAAGNLTWDGVYAYTYDAWNRLVKIEKAYRDPDDSYNLVVAYTVSTMQYDGTNRRIVNAVTNNAGLDRTEHFYYDNQWRIIEQRNGSGWVARHMVWGQMYIDELIQIGMNGEPMLNPEFDPDEGDFDPLWYHAYHDANFNIIATTGYNGLERYEYTPYGQRTVYLGSSFVSSNDRTAHAATILSRRGTPSFLDAWGRNPFGHQGLYHDELTGLVQNRRRMLHPAMKRFMQRDPLGYPDGMNPYAAYHMMHGGVDPFGLESKDEWQEITNNRAGIRWPNKFPGTGTYSGEYKDAIEGVYRYYQSLYSESPDKLLWAGAAAIAGQEVKSTLAFNQNIINANIPGDAAQQFRDGLKRINRITMSMVAAVYNDIAWQHTAYLDKGICEIRQRFKAGELSKLQLDGWEAIDRGRVENGTMKLLLSEQRDVLQPFWRQFNQIEAEAASLRARINIRDAQTFRKFNPDGDISDFADRWKWLEQDVMPAWFKLTRNK